MKAVVKSLVLILFVVFALSSCFLGVQDQSIVGTWAFIGSSSVSYAVYNSDGSFVITSILTGGKTQIREGTYSACSGTLKLKDKKITSYEGTVYSFSIFSEEVAIHYTISADGNILTTSSQDGSYTSSYTKKR